MSVRPTRDVFPHFPRNLGLTGITVLIRKTPRHDTDTSPTLREKVERVSVTYPTKTETETRSTETRSQSNLSYLLNGVHYTNLVPDCVPILGTIPNLRLIYIMTLLDSEDPEETSE